MGKGSFKNYSFDKVLRDKAFNIANNTKLDGYQRGLSPIVYRFFDKRYFVSSLSVDICNVLPRPANFNGIIVAKPKKGS